VSRISSVIYSLHKIFPKVDTESNRSEFYLCLLTYLDPEVNTSAHTCTQWTSLHGRGAEVNAYLGSDLALLCSCKRPPPRGPAAVAEYSVVQPMLLGERMLLQFGE